jgi:prepilin-type N-terminal cleavage/methylation domain-containing protein
MIAFLHRFRVLPHKHSASGFTLIELLVVIAILGLLAAVVLVALDPLEQTSRARDSGRISSVAQIGHALQAYASSQGGTYPLPTANWMGDLVGTGDIKQAITVPPVSGNICATLPQGNICYANNGTDVVAWTVLESKNSRAKPNPDCTAAERPVAVYSSTQGKAGILCVANINTITVTSATTLW